MWSSSHHATWHALKKTRQKRLECPVRQLGPVVRSIAAATGGGVAEGLTVSLLERFIEVHQADVQRLLEIGKAPATGAWLHDACRNEDLRISSVSHSRFAAMASLVYSFCCSMRQHYPDRRC